ncbi:MAG: zinc ribbon domain-containing protein [Chloroflexota bacterium]|nr:MAG: zinc ribbon domain-containing protein [Chloroflexota bacterium]
MDRRIFHGKVTTQDIGQVLVAHFNRGNLRAQQFSKKGKVIVQITTLARPISGGSTALTIYLEQVEDGVAVQVGEQAWLGIAASIGSTVLSLWRSPFNLIHRLDDIAQDVENIQISDQAWQVIENYARMRGATFELSERLRRMKCDYCDTANPVGESRCIACGAPLGDVQPDTCPNCGYVIETGEKVCPNCNHILDE